ncbi:ATP-binding protein [Aquabacterium sp.]|uniref:ATP-binding protein n=1 Tax=Aquabacterium sp. TaxID=1872578 RepID=UPI002BAD58CE|nr:BTAD domain-containing putative transcriptional regulator [Aquabacterium sp.]HSW05080.1 BTAD domain-containing putative transcriptional regulator [Aquabacterium sp.]
MATPLNVESFPLHLRLHGPPLLRAGSRSLLLERKAAGALAWLVLRGPVLRVRLAELLWPASPPEGARNNLRQLIFKLKKAMDTVVIDGQDELRPAAGLRVEAAEGELLAECRYDDCPAFAEWLETARLAQRQQALQARLAAADAALAAGDLDSALALARALVADDELSEPAHLRLVRTLYLRGERAAALDAAARCMAMLDQSLGVEPSADLQQLVATVRSAAAPAAATTTIPASVLRPPRLIGRTRELVLLRQARAEGRVAWIAGEPGLGKSRLLAESAAEVAGLRLLGARPGDANVPYAALARWLRALLADHGAALEPLPPALHRLLPEHDASANARGRPLDLPGAVAETLRRAAADGLVGLGLDDLHFCDEASLGMLQSLLDEPALASFAWLLASRPAEGTPALDQLADRLADEARLLPVALAPLDAHGVSELIASLALPGIDAAALAPELLRATGGNPMFVLETVKAMLVTPAASGAALPRPRGVGALIERRLRQLSPQALSLARVAALAGPDFGTDLAMQVLDVPLMALADAWTELEAAQVLRDQAFAHDLVYEATLGGVPAPIRRHVRRAIAEFLALRDAEPSRLAEHWLAAGEAARAAPLFEAAGRRAEAAARYSEARSLFERSAQCHDDAGQHTRAVDTRLALADLLMEAREFTASQAVLDGLPVATMTVDDRLRARMQRMQLSLRQSRAEEAVQIGTATLADEALVDEATPMRLATLRWTLAIALSNGLGRYEAALAQLQLAAPMLAQAEDPSWRCWFHSQHAVASSGLGEIAQALRSQDQAIAAARVVGRNRMTAGCLQNACTFTTHTGRLVAALDLADECLLLMGDTGGDDHFSLHVRSQRARLQAMLGRYGEAIKALEALTADDGGLAPKTRAGSLVTLALAWAQLGQLPRVQRALDAAAMAHHDEANQALMAAARCELAWLGGQACDPAESGLPHEWVPLAWRVSPERIEPRDLAAYRARWAAAGLAGHVVLADVLAAVHARQLGDAATAAGFAARALPALRQTLAPGVYRPWAYLEIARCAAAADPSLAQRAAQEGADWVHGVARFQLPEPLREGFLRRNRLNAELLALGAGTRITGR